MERIMAVAAPELKYAERLCSYINRKNALKLLAVPFKDISELKSYSERHRIELLLADEAYLRPYKAEERDGEDKTLITDIDASVRMYLTSETVTGLREDRAAYGTESMEIFIPKYQPAEGIIRSVLDNAEGIEAVRIVEEMERMVHVISVYSPVARCGKSSFALAYCRELARKNRVLYLNLEEFTGVYELAGGMRSDGLSEAMYLMKQGKLNTAGIRDLTDNISGFDWIRPVNDPDDLRALSGEDYASLINEIIKNSDYEYIVVDMNRYAGQADAVLSISDAVYMPSSGDRLSISKRDAFYEYLKKEKGDEWVKRVNCLELPDPWKTEIKGPYPDILMYGEMGDLVRRLGGV